MATETYAIPRLKEFKFRVEINGLLVALVQDFDPGDRIHSITEHAGAGQNHPSHETGMVKFNDAVLKLVVPAEGVGRDYFEVWANQAQDPRTGNGGLPRQYQRNVSFYEMKPDGNVSREWTLIRAQISHYRLGNRHSLTENRDVIEEIHLKYEYRELEVK
jgi:phage tail-like protein